MNVDNIVLKPEDRVLFIINDKIIQGSTRFQKYGFLLFKQYQNELTKLKKSYTDFNFYYDWKPHHFGPYSQELQKNIQTCITNKLMSKITIDKTNRYALTLRGRVRWRKFFEKSRVEMMEITEKINNLQSMSLYGLLKLIYDAYPEYAINSQIKESLDG